jgi:DNA-binding winged helix-turn-helix (wHTH) protein/tetratricopeptide (TPR) repeat protein
VAELSSQHAGGAVILTFEDYEVDTRLFELRRQGTAIPLEPQVFEVLLYLVRHHDRFVSKDEIIDHVWPERYISESALSSRIMSARKAIGDSGKEQRLIRTVHGRGYRFLGAVQEIEDGHGSSSVETRLGESTPAIKPRQVDREGQPLLMSLPAASLPAPLIGRDAELAYLHDALHAAMAGSRRIVFVTGEAGLGKTTLVEAFLSELRNSHNLAIGAGQCLEHHGAGEAYLPVLDALGRLCNGPHARDLIAMLAMRAPMWLTQIPWVIAPNDLDALERRVQGATRERMLREMVEWIEIYTAHRTLVLVLEDLHWADPSTVDLIGWIGRRQEPARLLVIGTYRPADVRASGHPLHTVQRELRIRGRCAELALPPLTEEHVSEYLTHRFGDHHLPTELIHQLHERAAGNALFMSSLVDAWVEIGLLAEVDGRWALTADLNALIEIVPHGLKSLIEHQLDQIPADDQSILEAAAVAGPEFSAAMVAAALDRSEESVEIQCTTLARQGRFLRDGQPAVWPDGTVDTRFSFTHTLYQDMLYERVPVGRLVRFHQRIGTRLEAAYHAQDRKPAAELALHFGRGRDPERAAHYLLLAARQALRRTALREAEAYLRQALAIVTGPLLSGRVPHLELDVRATLGSVLFATRGWRSEEAGEVLRPALSLALERNDPGSASSIGLRLASVLLFQGRQAEGDALLADVHPERLPVESLRLAYHSLLSVISFQRGAFNLCVEHGAHGLTRPELGRDELPYALPGEDLAVNCRLWRAHALWYAGYPDRALREMRSALDEVSSLDAAYSLAAGHVHVARLHHLRREPEQVLAAADQAQLVAEEHGYPYPASMARILRGWALTALGRHEEGLEVLDAALVAHRSLGGSKDRPYVLALFAHAKQIAGLHVEGLSAIDEACAALPSDGGHFFEAEIRRLRGVFLCDEESEHDLRAALEIARYQEARSLELRAATSLSRRLMERGSVAETAEVLIPIVEWFAEGHDTPDLLDAMATATLIATAG